VLCPVRLERRHHFAVAGCSFPQRQQRLIARSGTCGIIEPELVEQGKYP
jgi:hypothetical protein